MNEAVYDDIAWTCGWIIYLTFHNDMFSYLNFSFPAWAADGKMREESLSVLSNGSMASSHVSETGTKRVGEAYRRKLWTTLSVRVTGVDSRRFLR